MLRPRAVSTRTDPLFPTSTLVRSRRIGLCLPDESAFTRRQGLDRLMLGFAAPPQLAGDGAPLLGEHWPLDALEGARGQLLGRLVEFVDRLGTLADQLARPRPLAEWADDLQVLIDTLFDEREAGDTQIGRAHV